MANPQVRSWYCSIYFCLFVWTINYECFLLGLGDRSRDIPLLPSRGLLNVEIFANTEARAADKCCY